MKVRNTRSTLAGVMMALRSSSVRSAMFVDDSRESIDCFGVRVWHRGEEPQQRSLCIILRHKTSPEGWRGGKPIGPSSPARSCPSSRVALRVAVSIGELVEAIMYKLRTSSSSWWSWWSWDVLMKRTWWDSLSSVTIVLLPRDVLFTAWIAQRHRLDRIEGERASREI